MNTTNLLEIKDVVYTYKSKYHNVTAINHLSTSFKKGLMYSITGKSGSGKTTLLSLMAGLDAPTKGSILYNGQDLSNLNLDDYRKNEIAVIYQDFNLFPMFNSLENVMYPMELQKTDKKVAKEKAKELLELMDLKEHCHKHFPHMLSGGEKQRVLLAKALAQQPKILLLDEPTNHLDIRHTLELLDLLKQLQEESGLTIMAILHDLNIASLYADQMGLLNGGHMQGIYEQFTPQNEKEFSEVYNVQIDFQVHPTIPKNQVVLSPRHFPQQKGYELQ